MSENLQKKLPSIMLSLLILASIIEVIAQYYGSLATKQLVQKGHFVLALIVLIIGFYLVYVKFQEKKKNKQEQ